MSVVSSDRNEDLLFEIKKNRKRNIESTRKSKRLSKNRLKVRFLIDDVTARIYIKRAQKSERIRKCAKHNLRLIYRNSYSTYRVDIFIGVRFLYDMHLLNVVFIEHRKTIVNAFTYR